MGPGCFTGAVVWSVPGRGFMASLLTINYKFLRYLGPHWLSLFAKGACNAHVTWQTSSSS